jgi:predicted transglutaminase-like cysteine proteinase
MSHEVIIIGTTHRLQTGHSEFAPEHHDQFCQLLKETCKKYSVKQILEELTEDILPAFGVENSLGFKTANELGLNHKYLDLTSLERDKLGLGKVDFHELKDAVGLSDTQFSVLESYCGKLREYIWIVRTLECNVWPCLFICGADHGPSLKNLFDCIGKNAVLEVNHFQPIN